MFFKTNIVTTIDRRTHKRYIPNGILAENIDTIIIAKYITTHIIDKAGTRFFILSHHLDIINMNADNTKSIKDNRNNHIDQWNI